MSDDGNKLFESCANEVQGNETGENKNDVDDLQKPARCVDCQEFYASVDNRCSLCAKKHCDSAPQEDKEAEAISAVGLDDPNVIAGSAVVGAGIGLLAGGGLMAVAGAGIGALAASRKGYWGDQSRAAGKHVVNAAKAAKDVGDKWKIAEKANAVASDANKRIQDAKLKDKMDNAVRRTDEFLTASARRADELMVTARPKINRWYERARQVAAEVSNSAQSIVNSKKKPHTEEVTEV
ncbi:hypothetical protein GUITHDRAFT_115318 [Guillardia theta CCMP2712]|uniref:Uncharacterized protein n=1 Tax=Guillardia theta (strain CCMP2712) TaxID=905079 RepID=L1IQL1_GUITC|nr:hypothetical protein GUITHDRAFT_115318 [Guillardia theta CCMP2712]EKX38543.1 hypothetical protein GUITHDRAFT_115318 [Guillardia theta CCMP2712]|eukprot:XP_005825523.1 hypothetical protein GUITHDRAFT_115318 [Guillardia theta CCMP2712]